MSNTMYVDGIGRLDRVFLSWRGLVGGIVLLVDVRFGQIFEMQNQILVYSFTWRCQGIVQ